MRRNGGLSLCCKVNDFYYRRMVVPGVVAHDYCRSVSALLAARRLCPSDVVNISSLGRFLRLLSVWGDYRRPCQLLSKQLSVFLEISGAEADVPVGIGARVVQVRVEQTRIRTVVPVATTNRETLSGLLPKTFYCFAYFIYPPMIRPISLRSPLQTSYLWNDNGGAIFWS